MIKLNPKTKKAQGFIRAYKTYYGTNKGDSLYEIYGRYSWQKEHALTYCKELCKQYEGFKRCFCGHNYDYFSYAFLFKGIDGKTYLAYITYASDYQIEYNG